MKFEPTSKLLTNVSKTELKDIKGLIIHVLPQYYGDFPAKWQGYSELVKLNKDVKNYGFHYGIDQYDLVEYIPQSYQAKSIKSGHTYISTALYGKKPEEKCISVCLFICTNHDYEQTEKFFVRFLVKLLREHKLESKDLWRGFDLSKEDKGPLHMLDESILKDYLSLIDLYLDATDEKLTEEKQQEIDDKIEFISPFKEAAEKDKKAINQYVCDIYLDNKDKLDAYISKYKPYDKDIKEIKDFVEEPTEGEISLTDYPTGNKLQHKITQNPPGSGCSCTKSTDKLDGVLNTKETMVEPIYPDLITPPGGDIHVANGNSTASSQSSSNTPLTVEEFENRQKTFSMDNFKDVKKSTVGRPINCDDEFPVDAQIKKLEDHFPKVKIDKTTFDYTEDNHLGSVLGQALSKNLNMSYDMITEVSKRTEQRLVKIENNLSTVMRNLFRMSSRVNINCVYYGGQSVFGKYKCIRCLQDDRVNDGATVSIDQCLSCTRYEPIVGQVYAILDDAGSNVTQVIDDMQMAYMSLEQYKVHNKIEDMHMDLEFANLKENPSETPLPFSEEKWQDNKEEIKAKGKDKIDKDYKNGFIMDWNPSLLETQASAINKYDIEFKELNKVEAIPGEQQLDRELFVDSRQKALEYEKFEFDIKNYVVSGYSTSSSSGSAGGGSFGMGAADARKKIVDYALAAVKLSTEGKAKYSQQLRYSHGDKAIDGISYWDCSTLVQRAYEAAGIAGIGTSTHSQYPHCLTTAGGTLFPITNVKDALPGDMVWFKEPPVPTDVAGFQTVPYTDGMIVHHIAIYIGDNKYAHAAYEGANPDIKVSTLGFYNHEMCFGRIKPLIELDKQASQGVSGAGAWGKDDHGISDDLWNASSVADSNANGMIANMEKYSYKDILVKVAKEKGYDPYFIGALIAIETTGNPMSGGNYPGILQSTGGYPTSTREGIEDCLRMGIDDITSKASWLKKNGWSESNMHVLATAHNSGQFGTTDALGHSHETYPNVAIPMMGKVVNLQTCKIPEVAEIIYAYSSKYQSSWDPKEKRTYATKVLRAYNILYSKKALD